MSSMLAKQDVLQQTYGEHIGTMIYQMLLWLQIGCDQHPIFYQMTFGRNKAYFFYDLKGYSIWQGSLKSPSIFIHVPKDLDIMKKCGKGKEKRNEAMLFAYHLNLEWQLEQY